MPQHDKALELPIEELAERLGRHLASGEPRAAVETMTSMPGSSIQSRPGA